MVLTFSVLLTMSISTFATSFSTETVYNVDGSATVKVSNITANANNEVVFMAEKGGNVVFIDQKTASATGAVEDFTFTMTAAQASGAIATLRAGSTQVAAAAAVSGVTLTYGANGYAVPASLVDGNLTFYAIPETGYEIDAVNGTPMVSSETDIYTVAVAADDVVNVTFKEKVEADTTPNVVDATDDGTTLTEVDERAEFTHMSKADGVEFGILISTEEANLAQSNYSVENGVLKFNAEVVTSDSSSAVQKFAAMMNNNENVFGVTIVDTGDYYFTDGQTYYVATYAVSNDAVTIGTVSSVTNN
ncbi:MAG: hypothetical protein E7393_02525 [Ruminococcaceae bacterium]|nr:hypothetical protein [Oscillospiraceae bacterium]